MEEYKLAEKYLKKKKNKNREPKREVLRFVNKLLLSSLILVVCLGLSKNNNFKTFIKEKVFNKNISFAKINEVYNKYFGKVYPIEIKEPTVQEVFSEKLTYLNKENYKEGVKLTVSNNYIVPVLDSGIVVFSGNKDNYGNTTIIQQVNGIDVWYVGINTNGLKLYDYVEKGSILGEAKTDTIYIYYQKDGKFIDYKEYLG